MLLRAAAWDSEAWYDQVVPLLTDAGFEEREDLHGSDPESDGELMYLFFELTTDELPIEAFTKLITKADGLIEKAKSAAVKWALVDRK
ncbi:MAG TPA: hypothetical protein VGO93_09765 [Candidatus Xenobia bacterium]|jgi:hypothetical protein